MSEADGLDSLPTFDRTGIWTLVLLLPVSIWLGRVLAFRRFPGRGFIEAAVALPLVLPPTVLGFYLLTAFGVIPLPCRQALLGYRAGLLLRRPAVASVIVNPPFAVQPIQNGFAAIPLAACERPGQCPACRPWRVFARIELATALARHRHRRRARTFAHTLGESGVVLMVGGSIPGETQTIAIAIYDRVLPSTTAAPVIMSAVLLAVSVLALGITNTLSRRVGRTRRDG